MLLACRDCATIQRIPDRPGRGRLLCCRCERTLENSNHRSLDIALACSFTTLILLVPSNAMTLMTVHFAGMTDSTRLVSGLQLAYEQGWPLLSIVLGLQAVLLPFVRFGVLTVTLTLLRGGKRPPWLGAAFRWCEWLDAWAMADVLLIGAGIGYGRIASQLPVHIEVGGWCMVGAAVMTMVTRATLERRQIWEMVLPAPHREPPGAIGCSACDMVLPAQAEGQRCPRCAVRVQRRRPGAVTQTMALLLTTAVLTPIAYGEPMSEMWQAGSPDPHTVIDGIKMLFQNGFWYFGIAIIFVSVVFPLTKIAVLTWCLFSIWRRSEAHLVRKTKMYRFIDHVGRWSTLDPFTVIVFLPMVRIPHLAHFDVMPGCLAFLATVVLSMLAAELFDPRLMWDAAEGQRESDAAAAVPARA